MKLVPLGDKIVLKQLEAEQQSQESFCLVRQKKNHRKQR